MNDLIGKQVSWTHVSRRGRVMSMSLKCGTVKAINGDTATVENPRGKMITVNTAQLRVEGQPSQITEFVEALRGARQ